MPWEGAVNLSEDKEAAFLPHPGSVPLSPPELTHSMRGTVGHMFILRGLVPLVGRDLAVHEPGMRGTTPGSSAGKLGAAAVRFP